MTGKPASKEPLCGCLPTGSVGQPPVDLDLASIPAACLATGQQVQGACQATFDAAQNYFNNLQVGVAQWLMRMVALLAHYIVYGVKAAAKMTESLVDDPVNSLLTQLCLYLM